MRETLVIAKRELLERIRTKWFMIMTILGPVLMVGLIVIPVLLASKGADGAKVAIIDETGQLGDKLVDLFANSDQHWVAHVVPAATPDADLLRELREKKIAGFLRVPKDAFEHGQIIYRGDNATNQSVQIELRIELTRVMLETRGRAFHLSDDQLVQLITPPSIKTLHTNGDTEGESGVGAFLLGYVIAMILYFAITLYGVNVMRSVVTEKTSRVVELMVAATKPSSMMAGKILGVGGAGLLQISVWLIVGGAALANRDALLTHFGAAAGSASALPMLDGGEIAVIAAFFVLGYLFYSTLFAAVGAMVSSEQDSQQAAMPVTMLLVVAMVMMTAVTGDPRGHTSSILTQVPCWSPMLMPLRYLLGGATLTEVAISLGILVVSTLVVARAASKIYRVGILMYGKRPGLGELIRWLRY